MNNYQKLSLYSRKLAKYNQMGGARCSLCSLLIADGVEIEAAAAEESGICSCIITGQVLYIPDVQIHIFYTDLDLYNEGGLLKPPYKLESISTGETSFVIFTPTKISKTVDLIVRDEFSAPYLDNEDRKHRILLRAIEYFNTKYGDIYGKWNYDGTFKP